VLTANAAAWTGLMALFVRRGIDPQVWTAVREGDANAPALPVFMMAALGMPLALLTSLTAAGAHLAQRRAEGGALTHVAWGARFGRDTLLATVGLLAGLSAAMRTLPGTPAPPGYSLTTGIAALGVAVLLCLHAAWREGSARHVWFVQVAAVVAYGLVRVNVARGLPPVVDAFAGLALGFVLTGVTVQARRAGIPPVADATRRFAAFLPLLAALVMPHEVSLSAALVAAGASVLYGTLAYLERSRWFGSLGAAACNLALLLAALASGLEGVEFYLAPLGLMVLALGQIYTPTLPRSSRMVVRVTGALLLYAPAALQLTLQVGRAESGLYPLAFGAVCLVGVAAGMLLHIRAYLVLGTGFLVLDVLSSLVHAGLRDHRIGFLVLSLSGLAILGTMVLTTLRREEFRRVLARARGYWREWD
jgi:hypothetical protein